MSDLAAKFTALESQMTTQQTEVINALNAILDALGAPPPTATVTLATVAAQLTTMNTNIVAIATANAGFYEALLDTVGAINTNTDTIITNNSLNAQKLLAAILATYCPCTTGAPLLPPVIDVTPTEIVNDAKCRRIQFYLSLFSTWLFDVANYGSSGAAITGDVLFSLLSAAGAAVGLVATGAEVGAAAGIPGAVVGAVIGLIVGAVYFVGGSQLINYANDFGNTTVQSALLAALYNATNADEGQTAFQVTVGEHFDVIPAGIINALWWSAWSNDLYSGSPAVDDSAFDGSICGPPPLVVGCWSPSAEQIVNVAVTETINGATATYSNCVIWPAEWSVGATYAGTNSGGYSINIVGNANFVWNADLFGLWVSVPAGTLYGDNEVAIATGATFQQITVHTTYAFVIGGSTSFQICDSEPV